MAIKRFFVVSVFFCLLLFPAPTGAQTVTESAYRALLLELIHALQLQIAVLQAEVALAEPIEVQPEAISVFGDVVVTEFSRDIKDQTEVDLIRNREYREYFSRVFEIFPGEYADKMKRLEVFVGDGAYFDAYVETLPPEHEYWRYAVNGEIIEDERSKANTELIVHELGHIISYEEILGVPKPAETICAEYFDSHGCPEENSYLAQFVNQFWSTADLKRAQELKDSDDREEEVSVYYEQHENEYVTDYAAQAPEEDFADSFMFYVLEDPVKRGTEAREKVDFFTEYPKLVSIRSYIRAQR